MGLVPAYPEAEGNYQKYKQVYDDLLTVQGQGKLQSAASATIPSSTSFSTSLCEGNYYDSYITQMELWRTDAQSIKTKFSSANTELQMRITTAQSLRDHWDQLRKIMVDDGKE